MGKASLESEDLRDTMKPCLGSCQSSLKLRWRQLRAAPDGHRRVRCGVLKPRHPLYLRQVEDPTAREHSVAVKRVPGKKKKEEARKTPRHPGAMAPSNTTQYLMSVTYADMASEGASSESDSHVYGEMSPRSVSSALDSQPDFLDYQLRDFEEAFDAL